jgi:hypothetical protein
VGELTIENGDFIPYEWRVWDVGEFGASAEMIASSVRNRGDCIIAPKQNQKKVQNTNKIVGW